MLKLKEAIKIEHKSKENSCFDSYIYELRWYKLQLFFEHNCLFLSSPCFIFALGIIAPFNAFEQISKSIKNIAITYMGFLSILKYLNSIHDHMHPLAVNILVKLTLSFTILFCWIHSLVGMLWLGVGKVRANRG